MLEMHLWWPQNPVAYSTPDALAGNEGATLLQREGKVRKREEENERRERIGINERKRPRINFLVWPCSHFPNQNLKCH